MNNRALFVLPLLVLSAVCHALLIDGFSDGNGILSVDSATLESYDLVPATVLDGDRGVYVRQSQTDGPLRSTVRIANASLSVSNEENVKADVFLAYGAESIGIGGSTSYDLNRNMSLGTNSQIRIDFLRADLPLAVFVEFWYGGPTWTVYTKNVSPSMNPFSVLITDADLTQGAAVWTNFDLMRVFFVSQPSGDFAVKRIDAVPEPMTFAAMAIGLVGLLRRRLRR